MQHDFAIECDELFTAIKILISNAYHLDGKRAECARCLIGALQLSCREDQSSPQQKAPAATVLVAHIWGDLR